MEKTSESKGFLQILKGVFIALIATVIGILIFALILKMATLSNTAVKVVNQFIKAIALFVGCLFSLKSGMGLIKGIAVGIIWSGIVYLLFLLFGSNGLSITSFLIDLLFGGITGGISGIATVNIKG